MNKTKGTKESANPTAEQKSVKDNNAEEIVRCGFVACRKGILKSAEGASANGTGAGIATQTGGANILYWSFINVTRAEAFEVCIKEQCGINLNQLSF